MADTKKVIEILVNVKDAALDKLNKGLKETGKRAKGAANTIGGGMTNAFKKVGTAIKAAGIGLLVASLAKIGQVLSRNQDILDGFETAMSAISMTVNQVAQGLSRAYEAAKQATGGFDALGKVFTSMIDLAIDPFRLAFAGIQRAIVLTQRNWEQSIFGGQDKGRIAELSNELLEIDNNIDEISSNIGKNARTFADNFGEAYDELTTFGKAAIEEISEISIEANIEQAKYLTELGKNAELAQVQQQGLIEKYDREAELLRQVRDETNNTFEERIAANEELGRVLEKQAEEERELINLRQRALEENFKAGLIAEQQYLVQRQELANEEAAIEARITGFKSEQLINRTALANEQRDAELAAIKEKQDAEKAAAEERARLAEEEAARQDAAREAKRKKDEEDAAAKKALEQDVFASSVSLLIDLASLTDAESKRGFQIQKAASIAAAIANTAQAVTRTLAQTTDPTPTQSLRFANAAIVGAAGAIQVAKIASTKYQGGASSGASAAGGGRSGGGASPNVQFNTVGASGINQLNESITAQNDPVKAYVVSTEVSSAQSLDRNRQNNATFG